MGSQALATSFIEVGKVGLLYGIKIKKKYNFCKKLDAMRSTVHILHTKNYLQAITHLIYCSF